MNKNLTNLRYEVRVGASAFSPLLDNGALCIQLENTGIVWIVVEMKLEWNLMKMRWN